MPSSRERRSVWTRKITRRQVLRAGIKAGVGATALAAVGSGAGNSATFGPNHARANHGGSVERGGRITYPFVGPYSGNPPTLDPYENLTYRAQIASGYHYSRLIRPISAGPGVSPIDLAQSEADLASLPETPDSTTYLFRLNPSAHWHDVAPLDGRRVTASDIEQAHERFQSMSASAADWNQHISAFEAVGNTVRIDTYRPWAPLVALVGSGDHLWIIPPEIADDGTVAERPVGSGAWIFDSFEPGVALRWRRNPNWHGAGDNGEPFLDEVVATMNGATDVIIPALGDGSLDLSQLTPSLYEAARAAAPDAQYIFSPSTVPGGFFFNYSIPPWNDVRVRQALSLAMDRDAILRATDPTGHGGWQSAIAQFEPWWLDPKDLNTFGEAFEGEDSGILFYRDLTKARQLLDAAGYPDGIQATLHATADYGATVVNLFEACTLSAAGAGFQFEFFFKEYAAYLSSIFRGNFPDDWDGASSHLAIGPLYGGASDPDDIFSGVYDRTSGRHSWGSAGRVAKDSVFGLDTGGHAEAWYHPSAVSGDGPETDERLHEMFKVQRGLLDFNERLAYVQDIQRYMATKMYMVPYVSTPGVYAFNPRLHYRDTDRVHIKATYGWGQEFLPGLWVEPVNSTMTPLPRQEIDVRIIARRLSDGRIEFALRAEGLPALLPRGRYFPANPSTPDWLPSSPVELHSTVIGRIRARRLSDGRTEFGFVDLGGNIIEPAVRYFPANAGANRWLQSSSFVIGI